jgi:hypothetical protein
VCQINRLTQFAAIVLEPVKARVDFVPMIVDPQGPANRLGPKPCLVPDEDDRFAHALCESMVRQHAPSVLRISRDQNTAACQGVEAATGLP